jgi:hypothetical protein
MKEQAIEYDLNHLAHQHYKSLDNDCCPLSYPTISPGYTRRGNLYVFVARGLSCLNVFPRIPVGMVCVAG